MKKKRINLSVALAGYIFAIGLGISGMTNADKVIGFLNLGGDWDPSLAFVMVGAIAVHLLLFKFIVKRPSPLFTEAFRIPETQDIDRRLIGGSALFGIGWALGGFCPGPGLVSGVTMSSQAMVFVGAMLAGMAVFGALERAQARSN